MTKEYKEERENKVSLSDLPTEDKAQHHFVLQSHGFRDLLVTLGISFNGTIVHDYSIYMKAIQEKRQMRTFENVETYATSIVRAIERLHLDVFVK